LYRSDRSNRSTCFCLQEWLLNKSHVLIISPALANANNGNWQTARRWRDFLRKDYRVDCTLNWVPASLQDAPDLLIALHARRSAPAIAAFAAQYPQRPLILILTGTDLYRDIAQDPAARHSLDVASRLVVLQEAGIDALPSHMRAKTVVIHQSAPCIAPLPRPARRRHFRVSMIGHLRAEKAPQTFMQAAALVTAPAVRLLHIGAALDPALGQAAQATAAAHTRYTWLGALPHGPTRQRLRRSDLMVISSTMEGGANVIIEAVTCGVPVLASDISGNRGMLGVDYAGYFPVGDSAALAAAIDRAATDPTFLARLQRQCADRAALFAPSLERAAVRELVDNCLLNSPDQSILP
jgi:putative glycosyltransferase (TIGR04348 family)